jgi:hypothetical protein
MAQLVTFPCLRRFTKEETTVKQPTLCSYRPPSPGHPDKSFSSPRALGPAAFLLALLVTFFSWQSVVEAAPVAVRFSEGMVRGFLVLSDSGGVRIGSGDFLQVNRDGAVKSRTVLHLLDGSLHDETAVFTQERNFVLKSYQLRQKGPSFREDLEVSLERGTGKYLVKVKPRGGAEKVMTGELSLPNDVYNGMVPTVVKNLVKGAKGTVHLVAFTPAPRVIELEITPTGEDKMRVGDLKMAATHYLLKAKLGLLKIPAALLGRLPPDNHLWTVTDDVPAFVKFQGPLATDGPIWRIELTSPVWAK